MKKLLLILLCVPLLFSNCNKDDDNPVNNNGTGNFLENQDGAVWNVVDLTQSDIEKFGFYNANSFLILKDVDDDCFVWSSNSIGPAGTSWGNYTIDVTENTDVKLKITGSNSSTAYFELIFTMNTSQSNSMTATTTQSGLVEGQFDLVKSTTQSNLICP